MKPEVRSSLKAFLIELLLYGGLVAAYFFLVLHYLGDWINELFNKDRRLYATMALVLIICQGVLFEALTRLLLAFIKRTED